MKKITLPILLGLFFILPLTANAITFMAGEEYTLNKTETLQGNTYIGGGAIVISGTVNGDLMVGGGNITMDGNISKDFTVGGGNIQILGTVGEDVRIGGGNIIIGKNIGGDVVFGGGSIKILSGTRINGDVLIGGGRVIIDGDINGDLTIGGGDVNINGKVLGNVKIYTASKYKMSESAVITGSLDYKGKEEAKLLPGNVVGKVTFTPVLNSKIFEKNNAKKFMANMLRGFSLIGFLSALLAGVLLTLLFPKTLKKVVEATYEKFPNGLGYGFAVLILAPIATIIVLVTIIGIKVAAVMGMLYAFLIVLTNLTVGIFAGSYVYKLAGKTKSMEVIWHSTIIGIILLYIIKLVPILGWVTMLVLFLSVFGNIVRLGCASALKNR